MEAYFEALAARPAAAWAFSVEAIGSGAINGRMTDAALRTMKEITSTYVEDGYPNYQIWWFRLRDDDRASSELLALGLIESIGIWPAA